MLTKLCYHGNRFYLIGAWVLEALTENLAEIHAGGKSQVSCVSWRGWKEKLGEGEKNGS